MDDIAGRLLVVAAGAAVALLLARTAARFRQPVHAMVDLTSTNLPTGVVLFTSTDCSNCAEARTALRRAGFEFREVTWELEPALLEFVGIEKVPLAVFRGLDGSTINQIAGVPRRRALRRLMRAKA